MADKRLPFAFQAAFAGNARRNPAQMRLDGGNRASR